MPPLVGQDPFLLAARGLVTVCVDGDEACFAFKLYGLVAARHDAPRAINSESVVTRCTTPAAPHSGYLTAFTSQLSPHSLHLTACTSQLGPHSLHLTASTSQHPPHSIHLTPATLIIYTL